MSGFGDFLIGVGPALTEVIFVLAAILAFPSALRLLAWARRCRRARLDGQRRTRAMDPGDLVISREVERHAAYRASALTEVIARGPAVIPGDPAAALGCRFCNPPFDPEAWCRCGAAFCGDPQCGALAWLRAGEVHGG